MRILEPWLTDLLVVVVVVLVVKDMGSDQSVSNRSRRMVGTQRFGIYITSSSVGKCFYEQILPAI